MTRSLTSVHPRMLPPRLFLLALVAAVALHLLAPGPVLVPPALQLLGGGVGVLGLWPLLGANDAFRRRGTEIKTFDEPGVLVTQGYFRYSRNPMYLGFVLVHLGVVLALGTASGLLIAVLFFAAFQWVYIPFEEAACAAKFGVEYDRYRRRVGRWFGPARG